jgi:hypothetical protein
MPIKRLKPVKSVVAGEPLKPVKTVVSRTPEERMAYVDSQITQVTARMRKLKRLSLASVSVGVGLTAGISALFWYQTGSILYWELPLGVLGVAGFAYCAKVNGDLGNELLALAQERRNLAKQFPDSPYFHAPVEVP